MELLDSKTNVCLSGGAPGSDQQWGMNAGKAGHVVVHWSFVGHKSTAPVEELSILPQSLLDTADPYCALANKTLKRSWPPRWIGTANLLRRNWFQVCYSSSVYAISNFKLPAGVVIPIGGVLDNKVRVQGGTAWAVQMFIDRHNGEACKCFVFDQDAGYWFEWHEQVGPHLRTSEV
jgi:hypothetical protein